jgi:hypothetical protein
LRTLATGDWKKKHQAKATPAQMELYEANKHIHAVHEKLEDAPAQKSSNPLEIFSDAVAPAADAAAAQAPPATTQATPAAAPAAQTPAAAPHPPSNPAAATGGGLSDVCCTPADELTAPQCAAPSAASRPAGAAGPVSIRLAVLTVSDRATAGVYADESGPEIQRVMSAYASTTGAFRLFSILSYAVPDDAELISQRICEMSASGCNLILTTVGPTTCTAVESS